MAIRLHSRAGTLLAVGCLLIAASCDNATGPDAVEGTYTLVSLNGSALPYDNDGLGCCWYQAGALVLADAHYAASITARNFSGSDPFTATEWGRYTHAGDSLTFARDSFDVAALLLSPATVEGNVVELGLGGEGPGSPDQFLARFVRAPE